MADPRLATSWFQIETLPAHGALYQHTPEVAIAIGRVDGLVCGAHVLTTAGQQCVSEVLSALEPLRITSRGTNVSDGNMTCADDADCASLGADFLCSGDTEVVDGNGDGPDDDETDDVGRCFFFPGSRTPCDSSSDCAASEVCRAYVERASLVVVTVCAERDADKADLGAACGEIGVTFVDCEDFCASNAAGDASNCRAVCGNDGDCGAGLFCRPFTLNGDREVNLCQPGEGEGEGEGEGQ